MLFFDPFKGYSNNKLSQKIPEQWRIKFYDHHGLMRKEDNMGDRKIDEPTHAIEQITLELKTASYETTTNDD